ncbi:CLUMA_CG006083, isoform A, partial [Clunio marinus]
TSLINFKNKHFQISLQCEISSYFVNEQIVHVIHLSLLRLANSVTILEMEELLQNDAQRKTTNNYLGKILIGTSAAIAVGISVVCFPFVSPALRKFTLPFIPATDNQLRNILKVLPKHPSKGIKVLDIGSGDGRIVIEAAKRGFEAHGVELNYWLGLYSRIAALRGGVSKTAKFYRKDLWKFPLSSYNYCVIFGVEEMMEKLEEKFQNELKDGSTIIACRFPLKNWKPTKVLSDGDTDTVWVYNKSV